MKARLIGVLLAAVACSDTTTTPVIVTPGPNQVFMQGSAFVPATRTVTAGTTVQFVNMDGSVIHTATSSSVPAGAAPFTSGSLSGSGSFSVMLNTPGTYAYYCVFHGAPGTGMHGTIVVN